MEKYLPEHHYVTDENYVHTDNNYTDAEKSKLEGISDGAEVNKVISVIFNGVETIDPETRVATITITPADIKAWYEQNPDTNVFTDAEKAKLESINIDELSNKVEDVTLDGETIVKNKVAILTAKKIKDSYESNADTNAFTDADKALVEQVLPEVQKGVNQHEQRIDALEKSQIAQDTEIEDAKNSITELGNEVNSVTGRVTTLETSQRTQDEEISNLKVKDTTQDGRLDALETWKGTTDSTLTALGEKNTAQDGEISKLKEKDTSQDGEISGIKSKDTTQDGRLDALETSEAAQNADILKLKEDVKNAGKVDDVTVGGVSVVKNKIAKIPAIPKPVIVNHFTLDGILVSNVPDNDQNDIDLSKRYTVFLAISSDTQLPLNKFISFALGYSDSAIAVDPSTFQVVIGIESLAMVTDSSQLTDTRIIGFKLVPKIEKAAEVDNDTHDENPIDILRVDSLSVNIVTDGTKVSLDKAKSTIKVLGA